jgi:cell division septation protein DedD
MAMTIYARLRPEDSETVLWETIKTAGSDGDAVKMVLDHMAPRLRADKFPAYLELAYGPMGTVVRLHEPFYAKGLVPLATASQSELLFKLVQSEETVKRVVALDMMAGPNFALATDGKSAGQRAILSSAVNLSLDVQRAQLREIEAAIRVARKFRLTGSARSLIHLAYIDKRDLDRQGITQEVLAEILGTEFFTGVKPADADQVVRQLTLALDDRSLAPLAVRALGRIKDGSLPALGQAIEHLEGMKSSEAAEAVTALKAIYKPVAKPVEPPAPKPATKPAPKPADKPATKPTDKKPDPAGKPKP